MSIVDFGYGYTFDPGDAIGPSALYGCRVIQVEIGKVRNVEGPELGFQSSLFMRAPLMAL